MTSHSTTSVMTSTVTIVKALLKCTPAKEDCHFIDPKEQFTLVRLHTCLITTYNILVIRSYAI